MMAFDNKTNLKHLVKNKTVTDLDLVGGHIHMYIIVLK
jgi:hypothetical protein